MNRRFRISLEWLVGIGGSLVVIAILPAFDRFCAAHPAAQWVAMGAMLVAMFVVQSLRLRKTAKQDRERP